MSGELHVVRPGILTTVQDRGRFGHRAHGIAQSGAADMLSLAVGNALVHNTPDAAAIEITFGGAAFRFTEETIFALTGADAGAQLDGALVASWSRERAQAGQILTFGAVGWGVRTILAVSGGIDVAPVLGSRSTDLSGGFGGFEGRPLRAGDCLKIGAVQRAQIAARVRIKPPQWHFDMRSIRVLRAAEYDAFPSTSRDAFWRTPWRVTPQSNRIGYRLAGAQLERGDTDAAMLSHAVFPGIVQVPPSGEPIVLLSDAQTTGGYPRIGVVIEADLWKLAQVPIGGIVQFCETTHDAARAAWHDVAQYVEGIDAALASVTDS